MRIQEEKEKETEEILETIMMRIFPNSCHIEQQILEAQRIPSRINDKKNYTSAYHTQTAENQR